MASPVAASLGAAPPDVMRLIAARLDARSLCLFACTCRAARDAAAEVPLRPVLTCAQHPSVRTWMLRHCRRVERLLVRRAFFGPVGCWVRDFVNLEALQLAFCRVTPTFLAWLPPGLRHLDVHRLMPGVVDVFRPGVALRRLKRLETVRLTFAPGWGVVVVDLAGMGAVRDARFRRAPDTVLRDLPTGLRRLDVDAVDMLTTAGVLPDGLEHLRVRCDSAPLDVGGLVPARPGNLVSLDLSCPGVLAGVPRLAAMTALRSLRLDVDTCALDRAYPASLREFTLRARTGLGVGAECDVPACLVASVGDRPIALRVGRGEAAAR